MDLDELFDIYQCFLESVERDQDYADIVTTDEDGTERALLEFSNGFNVELSNQENVENSAVLICWWDDKENAVEITSLEQLDKEFNRS